MSPGRNAVGRARAVRVLLALTAVFACIGAVAYAATRPAHRAVSLGGSKPVEAAPAPQKGDVGPRGKKEESLLQPRFIEYPEAISAEPEAQFRFHVPSRRQQRPGSAAPGPAAGEVPRPRPFQCRLDGGAWESCDSPRRVSALALGGHTFAVRAFNRDGRPGPVITYAWRRVALSPPAERVDPRDPVDAKPFSVELRGQLEDLYPGFPAQELPVLITNPNATPIEVTSLTVALSAEPPQCAAENFTLSVSGASAATPVTVPANGSVSLPTATVAAPTIAMLNLPVNQDSCRGVEVPLRFDGEAQG